MERRRRPGAWITVAATALVLAACTGPGAAPASQGAISTASVAAPTTTVPTTSAPSAAPSPPPTATPTPEPSFDLAAIGVAYLAMADRFNDAAGPAFDELAAREHTEKEYVALHKRIVAAYDDAIADLEAMEFPPEITDEITGIKASWGRIRDAFQRVVEDPSVDIDAEFEAEAATYGKLADAVRVALGLPPRPTDPSD